MGRARPSRVGVNDKALHEIGKSPLLIFSGLMGANSLILTAKGRRALHRRAAKYSHFQARKNPASSQFRTRLLDDELIDAAVERGRR